MSCKKTQRAQTIAQAISTSISKTLRNQADVNETTKKHARGTKATCMVMRRTTQGLDKKEKLLIT